MDNTGIVLLLAQTWIPVAVVIIAGAPIIFVQHLLVRHYWPRTSILMRYSLGTATLLLCASLSLALQGLATAIPTLVIVALLLGTATLCSYELDRKLTAAADAAELEVRRGQAEEGH
jgi:hypothetical protein